MKGYIKLHRELMDHWIWMAEPFTKGQAWVDLLMMANHDNRKRLAGGKVEMFRRGTVYHSTYDLAKRWKWSRSKVTRFLDLLEAEKMVTTKRTTHGTTITIENYGRFQDRRTTNSTTPDTTPEPRSDTNNNYKKGEEVITPPIPPSQGGRRRRSWPPDPNYVPDPDIDGEIL